MLVSRLRSALGRDRIEHRDHGYVLRCDWLDAELAGLTEEVGRRRGVGHMVGAAAAARVALSLIRGDGPAPLPGEWARLKRADLEHLIRRARQVAATALLDAGDWMAAADAAATALERDPYDEAALRVLLRTQVMGGRVAAALEGWLARARVRTRRGLYAGALEDVQRAGAAGPAALEAGAWASYFGAGSRRPPSSPRTARWPRWTRRPGPGAWRPGAAPSTPWVTWAGPSGCSVRRSRWPRAPAG